MKGRLLKCIAKALPRSRIVRFQSPIHEAFINDCNRGRSAAVRRTHEREESTMSTVVHPRRGLSVLALAAAAALTFGTVMLAPGDAHAATPTPAVTATKTVAPVPTSTKAAAVATATKPAAPAATVPASTPAATGAKLPKTGAGPDTASANVALWMIGGALLAASGLGLAATARRRHRLN